MVIDEEDLTQRFLTGLWNDERSTSTWWWNRDVKEVVAKRKVCHKACRKTKSTKNKHTLEVAKKGLPGRSVFQILESRQM